MIEIRKASETNKVAELGVSEFTEYALPFSQLAVGISEIHGRYPTEGYEVDKEVEQVWYVESGDGSVTTEEGDSAISTGDMVLVPKGHKYAITGNHLKLVVSSSPPWTPEQHAHEV